ncbi:hypothetical protein [Burkholderia multivorans]|uniref:hypothetical protein n=1 Tax=Burkholderia multivorans TaxID=87883 RepID=UPI003BF98109
MRANDRCVGACAPVSHGAVFRAAGRGVARRASRVAVAGGFRVCGLRHASAVRCAFRVCGLGVRPTAVFDQRRERRERHAPAGLVVRGRHTGRYAIVDRIDARASVFV